MLLRVPQAFLLIVVCTQEVMGFHCQDLCFLKPTTSLLSSARSPSCSKSTRQGRRSCRPLDYWVQCCKSACSSGSGHWSSSAPLSDADLGQQDLLLWLPYTHTHGLQKSCGEKGAAWPLSKLKRGPLAPAWTGLYCFSGHITLRAILIYYAQVHHRWLPFKEDKGQDTANYFKDKDGTAQGGSCSHSILGRFSTDFRKMKILSKHLLPQLRLREFQQEQVSQQSGYNAGLISHWRTHPWTWVLPANLAPHWLFRVGAEPHFPRLKRFPTTIHYRWTDMVAAAVAAVAGDGKM